MEIKKLSSILSVDQEGLYLEKTLVCRVRVKEFNVSASILNLVLEPINTAGLNEEGEPFKVSAREDVLNLSPKKVSARYVGWRLYLDPNIIKRAKNIVSKLPEGQLVSGDYSSVPAPPGSKFVSLNRAGSVALEFNRFLAGIDFEL